MPAVAPDQQTVLPPDEKAARRLAELLDTLEHPRTACKAQLVTPDGDQVELPNEVFEVLVRVIDAMSRGMAITVAPHNTLLTTQQAADLLGVSRPTLVRLLENGEIPFEKPGRHRRIKLADLLTYQERTRSRRRATLAALTREAAESGLDESADEFQPTR